MKRVVFIHLLNNYTGSPKVLRDVILDVINSNKIDCVLLTSESDGFLNELDQKIIKRYRLFYKWHNINIFRLLYFLLAQFQIFFFILFKTNKNDIIYLNTILPFSAYLASLISNRKIVNHIHENMSINKILYKIIRIVYKYNNQHSIFVSKYLKTVTKNTKKSIVAYNSVSNNFNDNNIEFSKKKNVLMVSSLKMFKGVDTFINLAFNSNRLNFQLVVSSTNDEIFFFLKKHNIIIPNNLKIFPLQKDLSKFYREAIVGNPNLQGEEAIKYNIGAEFSLFDGLLSGEVDYFAEDRDKIVVLNNRTQADLGGSTAPPANIGVTEVRGYEIVLSSSYTFDNGLNLFGDFNFTEAIDKTIVRDDPFFTPEYLKQAGYTIGQGRSAIPAGILTSWDDVYMSTPQNQNQNFTRVGYYDVVDFDGDGVYDNNFDNAPFGYPEQPQRTWSATLGARYKGFSISAQLYGTQNASRLFSNQTFSNSTPLALS